MKSKTKQYILIAAIIAFVIYLVINSSWGPSLPFPGESVLTTSEYPKEGQCLPFYTDNVTFYGKPTYALDPAMQHMAGMKCSCDNQCHKWPPADWLGDPMLLKCCPNTGECYV